MEQLYCEFKKDDVTSVVRVIGFSQNYIYYTTNPRVAIYEDGLFTGLTYDVQHDAVVEYYGEYVGLITATEIAILLDTCEVIENTDEVLRVRQKEITNE